MFLACGKNQFRAVAEPSNPDMVRLLASDREYLSELVFPEGQVDSLEDSGEFSAVVSRGIFAQIVLQLCANATSLPAEGSADAEREEALAVAGVTADIEKTWRSGDDAA